MRRLFCTNYCRDKYYKNKNYKSALVPYEKAYSINDKDKVLLLKLGNIYKENKELQITGIDLVDRGCPNTIVTDFLQWNTDKKYDAIISNPPYLYRNI